LPFCRADSSALLAPAGQEQGGTGHAGMRASKAGRSKRPAMAMRAKSGRYLPDIRATAGNKKANPKVGFLLCGVAYLAAAAM
jgi:hypothetical protein